MVKDLLSRKDRRAKKIHLPCSISAVPPGALEQ